MKKLVSLAGVIIALAAPIGAHPVSRAVTVAATDIKSAESVILVPAATPVPVHVVGVVSSNNMKDGDTFQVQAAHDVIVNGMIVVREGSLGSGTIGSVDHAGGNGIAVRSA